MINELVDEMPKIGLGTWLIEDQKTIDKIIKFAIINCGYKLIDTAQIYNNEYQIGLALKKFFIDQRDIFITTKIWYNNFRYYAYKSTVESIKRLDVKYIDLVLLHGDCGNEDNLKAYKGLIKARREGLIKYIGVSNWSIDAIDYIYKHTNEYPYVNQILFSPITRILKLEEYCKKNGIKITGYSTVRPYYNPSPLYDSKFTSFDMDQKAIINIMAKKYKASPAQILLKWALETGCNIIPKSEHLERIKENIDLDFFRIIHSDIIKINNMNLYSYNDFLQSMKEWEKLTRLTDEEYKKGWLFDKNYDAKDYLKLLEKLA